MAAAAVSFFITTPPKPQVEIEYSDFDKLMDQFLTQFQTQPPSEGDVLIDKYLFNQSDNPMLLIKGDIHGDNKGLIKYLNTLVDKGYLIEVDNSYKIHPNYKDKIVIVFLGDYIDRGANSIGVLQTLLKLKIQNPQEVLLLRGNHESILSIVGYQQQLETRQYSWDRIWDPMQNEFYKKEGFINKLDRCFSLFSSCAYVGIHEQHQTKYSFLAHAGVDYRLSTAKLLNFLNDPMKKSELFSKDDFHDGVDIDLQKNVTDILSQINPSSNFYEDLKQILSKLLDQIEETDFIKFNAHIKKEFQIIPAIPISHVNKIDLLEKSKLYFTAFSINLIFSNEYYQRAFQSVKKYDISLFSWNDSFKDAYLRLYPIHSYPEINTESYFHMLSSLQKKDQKPFKVSAIKLAHTHNPFHFRSIRGEKNYLTIFPWENTACVHRIENAASMRHPIEVIKV
ncbi:MAG: hypothetical protein K1060chlam5_00539 [Candidatus Anoxychlamydiales bacterium]|nr:hypothetical protein [Candidatus Anoxychlamydiales bacterium]